MNNDFLNLTIDITSEESVQISFDRIAKDLMNNYALQIEQILTRLTESEAMVLLNSI